MRGTQRRLRIVLTRVVVSLVTLLAIESAAGCRRSAPAAPLPESVTLTIGFGLTTGANADTGIRQAIGNLATENLVSFGIDGRPQPRLATRWAESPDGLTWKFQLRQGVRFHDGSALTAEAVRTLLEEQVPRLLGPAAADIETIRAVSDTELEFTMRHRSRFVLEALDMAIARGRGRNATGPFSPTPIDGKVSEMAANQNYYGGKPSISRVVFRQYDSVRAAWADMLRGNVDMLYEVGPESLDLLAQSSAVRVFTFRRAYAYIVILNTTRPQFASPKVRRLLNFAINRDQIVADPLKGYATPADTPIRREHWANSSDAPRFSYRPELIQDPPVRFTCIYSDSSYERMALLLQQQLQLVGVDVKLESVPIDQAFARVQAGDFDAWLADTGIGPTLVRPYLFWHSSGPLNWGHYHNADVDAALDSVRHAATDDDYKAGVAAFQRAIVDDPPAIFLAWSERARAVSTRFDVPVEPGRDILSTLRLWRPVSASTPAGPE